MNYWDSLSSDKFQIWSRESNADMTGATFGWIVFEYSSTADKVRVRFLSNANDDVNSPKAESAIIAASTLSTSITLSAVGGSGISGTVTADGIRT